jgi:hypothetical protein
VFEAFELRTAAGQPDAAAGFGAQIFNVRHNQGRLGELVDACRANVESAPHMPAWRAVLARAYAETDQLAEARSQLDVCRADGFSAPLSWSWTSYVVCLTEAIAELGDREAAAALYDSMSIVSKQVDVLAVLFACGGSYATHCGMLAACLGRWDGADRHLEYGLAMNERLGARPYAVRTRRAWAAMLLDRNAPGDAARAGELIAAGRAEAEQLGMARELVRFDRLTERLSRA